MNLPQSDQLEIKYLSRVFDKTSECYKFFWLQAIVSKVLEGRDVLTYNELINEMIANAWYTVTEYHLNLGPRDTLESLIWHMQKTSCMKPSEDRDRVLEFLRETEDKEIRRLKNALTLNVPYRLQAPFMSTDTAFWNCGKHLLAEKINKQPRLIYYFNEIGGLDSEIQVSPDWLEYLRKNGEIVKGWLQYNMVLYLQKRNPSVPGISDKLYPPQERKLEKVKKYWKLVASITPVKDIYAGVELDRNNISIDHFVPWSYVAHDELWNLNPTTKSINSRKSNNLPDWETYFPKLSRLEFYSYRLMWENENVRTEFERCAREHLNNEDLRYRLYRQGQQYGEFAKALSEVLIPVYQSARNCGFREWKYE